MSKQANSGERERLIEFLIGLGVDALLTQDHFVDLRFTSPVVNAAFVYRALAAQGISVQCIDKVNALRINCAGDTHDFARLQQAMRGIFSPEAILFDMDGVLVNEALSYREAIRLTCQSFGETFTPEEIGQRKLCGDANNDWEFTLRLLHGRGVACAFSDVKSRFESVYQGTETSPGLWADEQILVDIDWLKSLADRYHLAIVTGRPRHDALRFLKSWQIEHVFGAIVCMEDGPAKPDPANVQTALRKLGVTSAWMIGDTPDDIVAARRAGLVALGIVAPQDDPEFAKQKLMDAFVTEILDNLKGLDSYLP